MHQPDWERFNALMDSLARDLGRPKSASTPELFAALVKSYFHDLRDLPFEIVETLASAYRKNHRFFPRVVDLRPRDAKKPQQDDTRNWIRDYWRSAIVGHAAYMFGYDFTSFEPFLVQHQALLGPPLRQLLDELEEQDRRSGRTPGMHVGCFRRIGELARAHRHLRTERAAPLPQQERDEPVQLEEELA